MSTTPGTPAPHIPQIRLYQQWLAEHRGLHFADYDALWRWSTTDLDAFWQSIWDYFEMQSPTPHTAVLERNVMPGAKWFPGAQFNYAQQVLRHVMPAHAAGFPAIVSRNEKGRHVELSWPQLRRQVASLALHLQAQGVKPGDRVAAYLPNIPETMVAFLAVASIGAVWSVCAPDMGTAAVLDRFSQITPIQAGVEQAAAFRHLFGDHPIRQHTAGERHQRVHIAVTHLLHIRLHRQLVAHCFLAAAGHHHGLGLTT